MSGFIQVEPDEGALATENTEAWVLFDNDTLYISARCWDSAPESQWVSNVMQRDNMAIVFNETFSFLLDTFYDRRNGNLFVWSTRLRDGWTARSPMSAPSTWTGIRSGEVRTGRFEQGWTLEAAIPFKSLRYRQGRVQTWGVNLVRFISSKNERAALTPLPAALGGPAIVQVSQAATLVGLEVPEQGSLSLEIKPYAISELTSDRTPARHLASDLGGDVGLDVKYGVTQNLVADFTVNTDFAQVEADEQAGQPHALQLVLSRETGILPGEPRGVCLWRCRHGPLWRRRQHADPLL